MEHRAFAFDFSAFSRELAPALLRALEQNDPSGIRSFVVANFQQIRDPYEGAPLTPAWEEVMEFRDVHQYGDFAMTKYYNPSEDIGLGPTWQAIQGQLSPVLYRCSPALGRPFGPPSNYFDPGKMGSYFQSELDVQDNIEFLQGLLAKAPEAWAGALPLLVLLRRAAGLGRGLYVTF